MSCSWKKRTSAVRSPTPREWRTSPRRKSSPALISPSTLFEQITSLGAEYELDEGLKIEPVDGRFKVTGNFGTYEAPSVLIATGVKHRKLGILNEDRLLGHGVSYCAVCDGPFYEGKDVLVIGDANSALQYAIMLAGYCHKVTVVTLFDKFFADDILVKGLLALKNVEIFHNLNGISFNGEKELSSVSFEDTKTHEKKDFKCDGAFVAIGQIPDNERFSNLVELKKGYHCRRREHGHEDPGHLCRG
jgi:thioredoxin reductase (NADPH)